MVPRRQWSRHLDSAGCRSAPMRRLAPPPSAPPHADRSATRLQIPATYVAVLRSEKRQVRVSWAGPRARGRHLESPRANCKLSRLSSDQGSREGCFADGMCVAEESSPDTVCVTTGSQVTPLCRPQCDNRPRSALSEGRDNEAAICIPRESGPADTRAKLVGFFQTRGDDGVRRRT